MTGEKDTSTAPGTGTAPETGGWLAFYRLQARLMWEWRPTRLAIVRRTILSFLVACLALALTAAVLPGIGIDGLVPLLLSGFLLLALHGASAVLLHWLLIAFPVLFAQLLGLGLQFVAIVVLGRVVPGVHVTGASTVIWGALLLTVLNGLFAELVAVSDDDSYFSVLVRRLVARDFRRPREPVPGLLVVQIDGLSLPVLQNALRAGRAPVLGWLLRDRGATLHGWTAMLPSTTPASQAGILHGRNDGIPGFRWYEKANERLLVANHPEDAAEIVSRISDGTGLLADDGASIGNLVTGDAPRSYLTMATIAKDAPADDGRRLRGLFVTTVNYIRLLVLMAGEVAKELYQAERQRGLGIEPRMRRDLHYAVERAVTNIALRTVSTALVIEEMYRGAPTIYVDYTGYDAVAHHTGPERAEAIDALEGIDRAIGTLLKAARHTSRPYRMVALSDHGQSLGATFQAQFGKAVEDVIADAVPGPITVAGTTEDVESAGMGRRIAAEFGRGSGLGPLVTRYLPSALGLRRSRGQAQGQSQKGPDGPPPDVVVCSSGNLAHVYFTSQQDRMSGEAIEARHPGLIEALARHPGVGAVIVRSADGHVQFLGKHGTLDLTAAEIDGVDTADAMDEYGPGAADALRRLEGFVNAGDLILLGAIDQGSGEATGFEELVGSHGGLGGWQCEAFLLCPPSLKRGDDALVGAPAIYAQLRAWQRQLNGRAAPAARYSDTSEPVG